MPSYFVNVTVEATLYHHANTQSEAQEYFDDCEVMALLDNPDAISMSPVYEVLDGQIINQSEEQAMETTEGGGITVQFRDTEMFKQFASLNDLTLIRDTDNINELRMATSRLPKAFVKDDIGTYYIEEHTLYMNWYDLRRVDDDDKDPGLPVIGTLFGTCEAINFNNLQSARGFLEYVMSSVTLEMNNIEPGACVTGTVLDAGGTAEGMFMAVLTHIAAPVTYFPKGIPS